MSSVPLALVYGRCLSIRLPDVDAGYAPFDSGEPSLLCANSKSRHRRQLTPAFATSPYPYALASMASSTFVPWEQRVRHFYPLARSLRKLLTFRPICSPAGPTSLQSLNLTASMPWWPSTTRQSVNLCSYYLYIDYTLTLPSCPIADTSAMSAFRYILSKAEISLRVLELTAAIVKLNPAHYTVWYVTAYTSVTLPAHSSSGSLLPLLCLFVGEPLFWFLTRDYLHTTWHEHPGRIGARRFSR